MLQSGDSETEILLGNKQLAGIFLAVAILLGVAFTAGYMVGHNGSSRRLLQASSDAPASTATDSQASATTTAPNSGGQTHTIGSEDGTPSRNPAPLRNMPPQTETNTDEPSKPVLGAHRTKETAMKEAPAKSSAEDPDNYFPRAGAKYLQVAAVSKNEAEMVADVLHKKGFHAHAVPKPGNQKLYRVIIGPLKDAGDLSTTRDALRKTGFREVIVQTY